MEKEQAAQYAERFSRQWYVDRGVDRAGFEIVEGDPGKSEVGGAALADFWDMAARFGQRTAAGFGYSWQSETGEWGIFIELVHASGTGGSDGMSIVRTKPGTPMQVLERSVFLTLANDFTVIWDLNLSRAEVEEAVQGIDRRARMEGRLKEGVRQVQPVYDLVDEPVLNWATREIGPVAVVTLVARFVPPSAESIGLTQMLEPNGKIGRLLRSHGLVPGGIRNWTGGSLPTANQYDLDFEPLESGGCRLRLIFWLSGGWAG